jgi:hypothetical protein
MLHIARSEVSLGPGSAAYIARRQGARSAENLQAFVQAFLPRLRLPASCFLPGFCSEIRCGILKTPEGPTQTYPRARARGYGSICSELTRGSTKRFDSTLTPIRARSYPICQPGALRPGYFLWRLDDNSDQLRNINYLTAITRYERQHGARDWHRCPRADRLP